MTAPSYSAVHARVQNARGRARRHACIDCGRPARQWSYDHADPAELVDARGMEYSTDPTHYDPRCNPCHRAFDSAYRKQGIPRLHALAAELEPQIRAAIAARKEARKASDVLAVEYWDDELERLSAPLRNDPRAERTA
ncbi:hypothetical protein [Mycolicibacterium fluoranthenivorans]|uniref:Cytochrome c553 n=1 Tax=Mycolicibacterium fluoranthenivorans TaxID=258505 RepID=A0A7X5U447_9MYCO|nr:hypothetical protein [Mycolicibacterium fluoranthenivorans]MCV7358495.1 hypothetical protein [Mycolicibacterium fluoranthenivorans]NIH98071.1 cytochrome c553 [Mycolicibacterium fluoranthenivorans]